MVPLRAVLGQQEHADSSGQADRDADLGPASIEAASISRRELDGENGGAGKLGTCTEALYQAKHKQKDWREISDLAISGSMRRSMPS
jgi:hypothetical protein